MDDDPLVGQLFADRFLIESVLGTGGMGTVYLAQHEVLQRRVAIKVIATNQITDRVMAARFRQEARAASRVEHPHITSVFDFGHTEDGRPYLVMEYAQGPTLREIIEKEAPLALDRALAILRRIADALTAAHGCQVVHRDLKPSNVVLTTHRGEPDFVKILDFGLAKVVGQDESLSLEGEALGTPAYMSPEQCMATDIDHRSDIYAFGILAYELIVGEVPFTGRIVEVASAHVSDPPPVPSEVCGRPDVTAELDSLVLRCLAKRKEDRYQDAAELRDDVDTQLRIAMVHRRPKRPSDSYDDDAPTVARESFEELSGGAPSVSLPGLPSLLPPQEDTWDEGSTVQWLHQLEPELVDLTPSAVEEIACVLRDRGLGTPELSEGMAARLRAEDRVMEIEARVERLRSQIADAEQTARDREARLRRALAQLEHERSQIKRRPTQAFGSGAPPGTEAQRSAQLEENVLAVSRTIQEIAQGAEQETEALQQEIAALQPELEAARAAADAAAQHLTALVQEIGQQTLAERRAGAHPPGVRTTGALSAGALSAGAPTGDVDTDVDVLGAHVTQRSAAPLAATMVAPPPEEPEVVALYVDDTDEPTAAEGPTSKGLNAESEEGRRGTLPGPQPVSSGTVSQVAGTVESFTPSGRMETLRTNPYPTVDAEVPDEEVTDPGKRPAPRSRGLLGVCVVGGAALAGLAAMLLASPADEKPRTAAPDSTVVRPVAPAPDSAAGGPAAAPDSAVGEPAAAPDGAARASRPADAAPAAREAAVAARTVADAGRRQRQLNVVSEPVGAKVYLNGRRVGKTPLTLTDPFAAPYYWLRFRLDGYKSTTKRVVPAKLIWSAEGPEGQPAATFEATLEEQPEPVAVDGGPARDARGRRFRAPDARATPPPRRPVWAGDGSAGPSTP